MDTSALHAAAPPGVRFVERFVDDAEAAAFLRRADLVVLPYREIEGSGVLATALAFGKPLLLTDVGSFPEVAATGAARARPAGRRRRRCTARSPALVGDPAARRRSSRARRARRPGPYAWGPIAERHLALYGRLVGVMRALVLALAALLAYAQAGYAALLALLARVLRLPAPVRRAGRRRASCRASRSSSRRTTRRRSSRRRSATPATSTGRATGCEIVVASDGSTDDTVARAQRGRAPTSCSTSPGAARSARRTPRSTRSSGEADLLAFGDANALWERDALHHLTAAFEDPEVGYACGQVAFVGGSGTNQEGLYWRYEMALRVARVPAARRHRAATARSTRCGPTRTCASTRSWATTSRSRSRS